MAQMAADMNTSSKPEPPRVIRMHPRDNVAIVVNDGGLARRARASAVGPGAARARAAGPQGGAGRHRRRRAGPPLRRRDRLCAAGACRPAAGSTSSVLVMPAPRRRSTGCRSRPSTPPARPPLDGYTFEGYRNADGSVGTRNILAITTTVQCVAGVVEHRACERIKAELLPKYPNVDDVVASSTPTAAASRSTRPTPMIPIRTLRNISLQSRISAAR